MASLASTAGRCHKIKWSLALAGISFFWMVPLQSRSVAEDVFKEAVNYVFTGRLDPQDAPEIVDRNSCIIIVSDPKNKRYIRYYLGRFKMEVGRIRKTYSGRRTSYVLEVEGDDAVIEYLQLDKTTVVIGYKSAQIAMPGDIDQIEKALKLIFAEHCKADKQKTPF